jgi:hypothetical protein
VAYDTCSETLSEAVMAHHEEQAAKLNIIGLNKAPPRGVFPGGKKRVFLDAVTRA